MYDETVLPWLAMNISDCSHMYFSSKNLTTSFCLNNDILLVISVLVISVLMISSVKIILILLSLK